MSKNTYCNLESVIKSQKERKQIDSADFKIIVFQQKKSKTETKNLITKRFKNISLETGQWIWFSIHRTKTKRSKIINYDEKKTFWKLKSGIADVICWSNCQSIVSSKSTILVKP